MLQQKATITSAAAVLVVRPIYRICKIESVRIENRVAARVKKSLRSFYVNSFLIQTCIVYKFPKNHPVLTSPLREEREERGGERGGREERERRERERRERERGEREEREEKRQTNWAINLTTSSPFFFLTHTVPPPPPTVQLKYTVERGQVIHSGVRNAAPTGEISLSVLSVSHLVRTRPYPY